VRETLRAAAMTTSRCAGFGMNDFGFSKTLDETLKPGRRHAQGADGEGGRRDRPRLRDHQHSIDQGHGHHRASFWAIAEVLKERAAKGCTARALLALRAGEGAAHVDPSELDAARARPSGADRVPRVDGST